MATITQTSIVNTILSGTSLTPKFTRELQGLPEVFGFGSWGEQFYHEEGGYLPLPDNIAEASICLN
jgi:hypothetical protein